MEVLEPESLRRAWLAEARAVLERYGQSGRVSQTYWAHTHPNPARWQPLREHLRQVAERAAAHARPFGEEENARLAGLLHDLGKYGELFQRRLEGKEKASTTGRPGPTWPCSSTASPRWPWPCRATTSGCKAGQRRA